MRYAGLQRVRASAPSRPRRPDSSPANDSCQQHASIDEIIGQLAFLHVANVIDDVPSLLYRQARGIMRGARRFEICSRRMAAYVYQGEFRASS